MPVTPPPEAYFKMLEYAKKKAMLRWDQLALQSLMAGLWVALFGHLCCSVAGSFYFPHASPFAAPFAKLLYAVIFPGAFVAVIWTGSELFTANTATMLMHLISRNFKSKALVQLARVWTFSLVGNFIGTAISAYPISYVSGAFETGSGRDFLLQLCSSKVSMSFTQAFIKAVGANCLVCLAAWCCVSTVDGAGKVLTLWFCITGFILGGFEHVIANVHTLSSCVFYGSISTTSAIFRNLIPVLIGNVVAGTVVTGAMWSYAFHPRTNKKLEEFSEGDLIDELVKRRSTMFSYPPEKAQNDCPMDKAKNNQQQQSLLQKV